MTIEELNAVFMEYQSFNELKGVRFGDFCSPSHWRDLAIVETLLAGNFAQNLDNQRFMNLGLTSSLVVANHLHLVATLCMSFRIGKMVLHCSFAHHDLHSPNKLKKGNPPGNISHLGKRKIIFKCADW